MNILDLISVLCRGSLAQRCGQVHIKYQKEVQNIHTCPRNLFFSRLQGCSILKPWSCTLNFWYFCFLPWFKLLCFPSSAEHDSQTSPMWLRLTQDDAGPQWLEKERGGSHGILDQKCVEPKKRRGTSFETTQRYWDTHTIHTMHARTYTDNHRQIYPYSLQQNYQTGSVSTSFPASSK